MLMYFFKYLMTTIKGEKYVIDNKISSWTMTKISTRKFVELSRGLLMKTGIKGTKKNVFIGKHSSLYNKQCIYFGDGVQIKDYVEIDGLSKNGIHLGDNASIGNYSIMRGTGSLKVLGKGLKVGKNFGCGDFCFFGCSGGIAIGDNVIMGQNVRFHSQNHIYNEKEKLIKDQGVDSKGITIGSNCWIGSGVVILDGVEIGDGCVIGANSLVNKNITKNTLAFGSPVKMIKNRVS